MSRTGFEASCFGCDERDREVTALQHELEKSRALVARLTVYCRQLESRIAALVEPGPPSLPHL